MQIVSGVINVYFNQLGDFCNHTAEEMQNMDKEEAKHMCIKSGVSKWSLVNRKGE